jgi:predicted GNAT family acetyltransferase
MERATMLMVSDNPAMSRFEMTSGAGIAFVEYRRAGDRIVLTHTEVPEALSGQGVGSKLVARVLDKIRSEGALVVAECEFVVAFIERHPGYRSLLGDE